MSTPTGPQLSNKAAGLKKATTWGTAVALGASDEILFKKISGLKSKRKYVPGDHADSPFRPAGVFTDFEPVDLGISGDLSYELGALGRHLALLMGTAGAPTKQGATTAYKHVLKWADYGAGFYTFAAELPGKIYEVPSVVPTEFLLKVENGVITFDAKGRGDVCKDDSAVNAAAQIDALTPAAFVPMIFKEGAFYLNGADEAVDVLTTTPLVTTGFDVAIKRSVDGEHAAGSASIIKPEENDFPAVSLKLQFPRFATANAGFLAKHAAGTPQKAAVQFTSPLEAGTGFYYSLTIYFPRLVITDADPSLDKIIKHGLELVAEQAASIPTGMDAARPYIEIINKQETDYLA